MRPTHRRLGASDGGVEAASLLALLTALLWLDPYGELGLEVSRSFLLQLFALLALAAALWRFGLDALAPRGGADGGTVLPSGAGWIERWAIGWGASAVVATLFGVDRVRSLLGATPRLGGLTTSLALVALGLLGARHLGGRAARERLEEVLLLGGALVTAYGLLQVAGLDPLRWQEEWQGRPISTQGNPLFLGQLLVWLVPVAAARAASAWRDGERRAALAAAALALAELLLAGLTEARGALLGLAAAGVAFLFFGRFAPRLRRSPRPASAFAALALAAVGLTALPVATLAGRVGGTAAQRLLLWRAAEQRFVSGSPGRWLVGYGPESQALVLPPFLPEELPGRLWTPDLYHDRAHNLLLDALLERGLLGAVAEIGLLASALLVAMALVRRGGAEASPGDRWRIAGWSAGLAGQAVATFTGVTTAAGACVSWVVLGALASAARESGSEPSSAREPGSARAQVAAERARRGGTLRGLLGGAALALLVLAAWVPRQVGAGAAASSPAILLGVALAALPLVWTSLGSRASGGLGRALRIAVVWAAAYAAGHALLLARPDPGSGLLALAVGGALAAAVAVAWNLADGPERSLTAPGRGARLAARGLALLALVVGLAPLGGLAAGVAVKEGRSALVAGDLERAAGRFARAERLVPWLEEPLLGRVRARLREAESPGGAARRDPLFAACEAALARAESRHPLAAVFPLDLGHLFARWADGSAGSERAGRFARADAAYRRALALDPGNAVAERGLGTVLLDRGAVAEARRALETSVRLAPRSLEGQLLLGRARLAGGEVEAALTSFAAARALDPRRARALLEGLAAARPGDLLAARDLAAFEIVEGRREAALTALRRAMSAAAPDDLALLARMTSVAGRLP